MGKNKDEKTAMIFQGISANYKESFSMLNDAQLNETKKLCDVVHEKLSYDLWSYICDTNSYTEDSPELDWMAIYAANHSIYRSYLSTGYIPSMSLGYSMGLITAVACNGAIAFEDGLDILNGISRYRRKHSKCNENMAIIIGKTECDVEDIIEKENLSDSVSVSIVNNEDCITISGEDEAIDQIVELSMDSGALQASKLNSPNAFHSHFTKDGVGELEKLMASIDFKDLEVPILSVYNQELLYKGTDVKHEIIKNMYSKMDWMNTLNDAAKRGVDIFVDISTDASLTKLSRIVLDDYEFITLGKLNRDLDKLNI